MKKWQHTMAGVVIGAGLAFSFSAAAEEVQSIIGKTVSTEYSVTVNGEQLQAKAGAIDGTSYLPVRAVSDALNLSVSFDPSTGISLETKEVTPTVTTTTQSTSTTTTPAQTTTTIPFEQKRAQIEGKIDMLGAKIYALKANIEQYPDKFDTPEYRKEVSDMEAELKVWEDKLKSLEASQ